ncbi:MAG: ferritin family protein [Candidatus Bathyarchaeia archaeon]
MSQETLVDLIKQQIAVEKNFVATISKELRNIHNVAAKLLLLETQKDSEKHALILEGILDVISQKDAKPLWDTLLDSYVDKIVVRKNLENHIKTETTMLEHIKKEMKETKDEGIRLLLEHIASDEEKHHKILQTVIKNAYKIKP